MMLKQGILYLLLSVVFVMFAKYVHLLIVYIDMVYTYINIKLAPIFSNSDLGVMIRSALTLIALPLAIAAIPALIYRMVKRKNLPYFIEITWILWLIIVLSKVLIH